MHPVERVRHVDDPVLLADRLDRVGEGHAAWDLLVEEEPDHLALVVGLHLLARNHDQLAPARELDRLERAGEDVVVGDGDRSEPLRLGVVDERLRLDRAVVRPVRVHVQVDDDPVAVAERVDVVVRGQAGPATALRHLAVDLLERSCASWSKSRVSACARASSPERVRRASFSASRATAAAASSGWSATPAGSAIAQAHARCLEQEPGAPARDGHEDGRLGERRLPRVGFHERAV